MKTPPYPEIPLDEFRRRVEAAQAWMAEQDIDACLFFTEEDVIYYTGFRITFESPLGFFHGAILPQTGDPILVVPQITEVLADKSTWVNDIRAWGGAAYWGKPRDPVAVFTDAVKGLPGGHGRLGMELGPGMLMRLTYQELQGVLGGLGDAERMDITDQVWKQRQIKTPYEVEVYRKLADIAVKGFRAGLEALREGVTEREVLQVMWQTFIAEGAHDTPMRGQLMMRAGRDRYDIMCARPVDRKLGKGEQLMLDSGPCYEGYVLDMQRQGCIGEPSPLERRLYDQSLAGFEAALSSLKPGVTAGQVREAAVAAMLDVGVNPNVPMDFFGHGIGLCNHEPPYIVPGEETVLQENMVLAIEVPTYDVPEFRELGGFLEDEILITADGHENLTGSLSHELWIVE